MNDLWQDLKRVATAHWSKLKTIGAAPTPREQAVAAACERVIDQVDPRLRGLSGYRRTLHDNVAAALDYSADLASRIPGPVTLNRETWAQDPLLNAMFADVKRIRWVLSSPSVCAYVRDTALETGDCYALLAALPMVRNQLGMELQGDAVHRDIPQTTWSFVNHEVGLPAGDPDSVRGQAAQAIMDIIAGGAVQEIGGQEARIAALEEQLRMTRIKQKVANPATHGLDFLSDGGASTLPDYATLGQRIQQLEQELAAARQGLTTLDDHLQRLNDVLAHPQTRVAVQPEQVRLDRMNVVREDREGAVESMPIEFLRGYRGGQPARVILLIRFARADLITADERLAEVERYVNA